MAILEKFSYPLEICIEIFLSKTTWYLGFAFIGTKQKVHGERDETRLAIVIVQSARWVHRCSSYYFLYSCVFGHFFN